MASSSNPWDTWTLDEKFLTALSCWTIANPESSIDRVLDKICIAIDANRDVIDCIPDSPFPARSLVKALCQLIKIGAVISKAKTDVQALAREIVHWISQVASAFKNGDGGHFTRQTWKHLERIRDLVNEICQWATSRLVRKDRFFRNFRLGRSIGMEVGEFKFRFSDATKLFMTLSAINSSQGHDAIIRHTEPLGPAICSIHDKMTAQQLIEDITITLSSRIATKFTYVDQGKTLCDPQTRTDILNQIDQWAYDTSDNTQRLFWLTGVPGSGKSSIAASIASKLKNDKSLWAQFFISRSHAGTINPNCIFPTIAHQLAKHHPEVAFVVHEVLDKHCSLVDYISDVQATKLFVEPMKVASNTNSSEPIVIVIDGLDETDMSRIAEILSKAISALPRNAKVFISSRSVDRIQTHFSHMVHEHRAAHIDLDPSAPSSVQDVARVFKGEIKRIVDENHLKEKEWPGTERMQTLCDKASGLFIWAVTAIKYIRARIAAAGSECLDEVLGDLNAEGMQGINALYHTILNRTCPREQDIWAFERFRRIVGGIIVLQEPLALASIEALLNLQKTETSRPVDIEHFIRQFRTVLVIGTDDIDEKTVPRLHKSFVEFVTKDSDDRFRVDIAASHAELVTRCLHQLIGLNRDMCNIEHFAKFNADIPRLSSIIDQHLSTHLRYACRFWSIHLSQAKSTHVITIRALFRDFFIQHLLHWIEVMSLLGYNYVFSPLERASEWAQIEYVDDEDLTTLINDAIRFVKIFSEPISKCAAHTYISALPFTPRFSSIYKHYQTSCGQTIDVSVGALQYWPQYIWQSGGHTDAVKSVAFSPDGNHIVSSSKDRKIRLWDAASGQPIGLPLRGHTSSVTSVAFSPDGKHIVSGSEDETVCLWDSASGQCIGSPLKGHSRAVRSVAFSPDGKQIVSSSNDGTVCLWGLDSGYLVESPLKLENHPDRCIRCVAFSPDSKQIVSGSDDDTIYLWDSASGKLAGPPLQGHEDWVRSVAFSPDGKQIVSASDDGTICLWDAASGQLTGPPIHNGDNYPVLSVAFSPNGRRIVSGSAEGTIRLWDVRSGQLIGSPLKGHNDWVISVAFSPDGKQIVSGSDDATICLWDGADGQTTGSALHLGHTRLVTSIAFSPDGKQVVSGAEDGTICIWDAASGQLVGSPIEGHDLSVRVITFSPDGKQILSGSAEGTICLWDATSGKLNGPPLNGHNYSISCVVFSPDGKQIVSGSAEGAICLWDAGSGHRIGSPLKGHTRPVTTIAFSPDAQRIVSASDDDKLCLWDSSNGKSMGSAIQSLTVSVRSIDFPPDSKEILSGSDGRTIWVWDTASDQLDGYRGLSKSIRRLSLTIEQGWVRDAIDRALLYHIPVRNFDTDVWACNGARVALGNSKGLVTIIDATRIFQSRGVSP